MYTANKNTLFVSVTLPDLVNSAEFSSVMIMMSSVNCFFNINVNVITIKVKLSQKVS